MRTMKGSRSGGPFRYLSERAVFVCFSLHMSFVPVPLFGKSPWERAQGSPSSFYDYESFYIVMSVNMNRMGTMLRTRKKGGEFLRQSFPFGKGTVSKSFFFFLLVFQLIVFFYVQVVKQYYEQWSFGQRERSGVGNEEKTGAKGRPEGDMRRRYIFI